VLALPTANDPYILDTDASDTAIGAELLQVQNGEEKVIAFSSFTLTPEQRNYCTARKELMSIVRFARHFRHYLLGRLFIVRTDHSSLTWLLRFKEPQGQLARWIEELSQYHMIVQHRPGVKHGNADALSRIPDTLTPCSAYIAGLKPSCLPCGGCKYCVRAHEQWGKFITEVDEAVGLAKCDKLNAVELLEKEIENTANEWAFLEHGDSLRIGETDAHFDIVTSSDGRTLTVCSVAERDGSTDQPSCWGFSFVDLKEAQAKDKDLAIIIRWLSAKEIPEEGVLFLASPEAKFYWLNKELFHLTGGVLFKKKLDSKDLELVYHRI
jgi:hypothetical protein